MNFNAWKRDKFGVFLFILVEIMTIYFAYGANFAKDYDLTSYLIIHKVLLYFNSIMTIWCHIKCALTDPGKYIHELNPHLIEFYCSIRETGILEAMRFNQTYGKLLFQHLSSIGADYDSDEFTDGDTFPYEAVTSIQDNVMEKVSKENFVRLKRCSRCFVVRVPGTRHCSKCQGCILKMDHHCPWIFNCVGQFNQKYFIQFIFYSFCGLVEASLILFYYIYYKDRE